MPLLAAILLVISAALAFAALQQPAPAQEQAAATSDAYQRWVDEDVAYIIQDQERHAFKDLTTNAERDRFIEQFWERRDPTPGTAQNEFKEEHYRRIAYTNSHFSSPTIPGWKTDAGRIYITFGPPDEIDAHIASCSLSAPAHEDWTYRWIEGIGNNVSMEFRDDSCTGEFRMTSDPSAPAATGVGRSGHPK
jgi:GWxTD domain-containing protein